MMNTESGCKENNCTASAECNSEEGNCTTSAASGSEENNCAMSTAGGSGENNCTMDAEDAESEKKENDSTMSTESNAGQSDKPTHDPYAYLRHNEFSSEQFKIEIRGLPKFYGLAQLKKLLNRKLGLNVHKIKPPRERSTWVFACFKNEDDRQKALLALNGYEWKHTKLTAEPAKAVADPLVKRRRDGESEDSPGKKPRLDISLEEMIRMATIPLGDKPYEEQLKKKWEKMRDVLRTFANNLAHANPDLREWVEKQKMENDGMICPLGPVLPSPLKEGYRNKCEFTIGLNPKTHEPTVGFRVASYKKGSMGVVSPLHLYHMPENMKAAVEYFEKFVRASKYLPFNPETHQGYWKQLTVRTTQSGEMLLLVIIHPQCLTEDELKALKQSVLEFFSEGEGKECNVTSLYFQALVKRTSHEIPPEHLFGSGHIVEQLLGLDFRVSPEAFFQINSPCAEVLYRTVGGLVGVDSNTTLIDVCCGTGTIGLCLARECSEVLGVELIEKAVDDARYNAEKNGITNADFFAGKAEDLLSSILHRANNERVVAVVDPPRAGIHQRTLTVLRRTESIERLAFLSCDPSAATKNFIDLGRQPSGTYKGEPFIPESAVAVDMFPHTDHCELVVSFRRASSRELGGKASEMAE